MSHSEPPIARSATRHRRGPTGILRWMPRLAIPLLIAGALVVEARIDRTTSTSSETVAAILTQIEVPPPAALTSTWFCPVVGMMSPAPEFGDITTELLLTNMTDATTSVSVELRGRTTGQKFVTADVGPYSTGVVNTADYVRDEIIGALVEASSGGLAVSRRFVSALGVDEAGCSSVLAPDWHIPVGDTQADALTVMAIMNPLPRDAIVDVTFASEAEFGPFIAPELTGVVVPAWSTVTVDIGVYARRRDIVAASVRARTGRVAVDSLVAYDGSVGRRGFSAELASLNLSERWLVPLAGIDDQTHVWVRVFNPSDEVAEVAAEVITEGSTGDRVSFAVNSQDVLELTIESPGDRAPGLGTLLASGGMPFGISVASQNGVPIVVWADTLAGSTASPLTDIPIDSDRLDDSPVTTDASAATDSVTVVAQTDENVSSGIQPGDLASGGGLGGDPDDAVGSSGAVVDRPPVLAAASGLASVPGTSQARDRWLVVAGAMPGAEAFLTIMMDPPAAASDPAGSQGDAPTDPLRARRVAIRTLAGETVAFVDVPASGVVTHRLSSGTTRLVVSDTPFVVLLWQARSGGVGLSVAHPVGW